MTPPEKWVAIGNAFEVLSEDDSKEQDDDNNEMAESSHVVYSNNNEDNETIQVRDGEADNKVQIKKNNAKIQSI